MVPGSVVRRVASLVVWTAGLLLMAPGAMAQGPVESPQTAVRLAKASFEYRDFKKVVELLDPWLHPPRIVDPKLEVQARELLGVSQHVLGELDAAEEEFAQLLKLDPKHELDPFLVPPPVVQTFEEVRAKMKPILDSLNVEPTKTEPPPVQVRTELRLVPVPHPAVLFLPLGIPQFVMDKPGWGALWGGLQLAGLALNIVGAQLGNRGRVPWLGLQFGGPALLAGAWVGSTVQGYGQLEALKEGLQAPPPTPAGPPARVLQWGGTF